MEIFKTHKATLILFLLLFLSSSPYPGKAQSLAGLPQSDENVPLLASPPFATTIVNNKPPFAKSLNNQGQQSQLGYQQQQQLNYPQQGLNQPLSSFNQPFGPSNQQGSVDNTSFDNGVSKQNTFVLGVVLVSLVSFMVSFGYFV